MTETADWLASIGKATGAKAALALSADTRMPDAVAEQAQVATQLGLPQIVVGSDPALFKARAEQKRTTEALAETPLTAKWLLDRDNGVLAKDDVENLTWFERNLGAAGRAAGRGVRRLGVIGPEGAVRGAAVILSGVGKSVDDLYAEELARMGPGPYAPMQESLARNEAQARFDMVADMTPAQVADAVRRGANSMVLARRRLDAAGSRRSESAERVSAAVDASDGTLMGVIGALASDPLGSTALVLETAVEALPVLLAAAATTAATRSPAAGVGVMAGGSFLQENSVSAMEFLAEKGLDVSTPEAAALALQDSALMQEAADRGLSRGVVIAMFDAVSGGVAGQALMKSAAGEVVAQGIAQGLFGAGGEAAAQYASGQDVNWRDIVLEGLTELATSPVEVLGVAGRGFLRQSKAAEKSGTTAGLLAEVDAAAAKSKLRERSPEKYRDLLDKVTEGQTFHVPADDLNTFFQAKDLGPEAWDIEPADFAEQLAAGGMVAVPASVYASRITGTDAAPWFAEHATMDIEEMSVAEAARFNAEVRDILDDAMAEADRARSEQMELRAADVQVRDDLFGKLRAAGRSFDVADKESRVVTAFLRTMSERYGGDAVDMAERFALAINGPQDAPQRRRDGLDIALNTLRRGGGKVKAGTSLAEFITARGGIRDTGGDFEAMGAPKGLIGETRAEVQERLSQPSMIGPSEGKGDTLDNIARRAVEAGYFPDLMNKDEGDADIAAVLMEALRDELAGNKRYIPGQEGGNELAALEEMIGRAGVTLDMSNDEIAAALEQPADGQTYNQDGTLKTDTAAFKAWFGDSKVVDADGNPLVVYHGTGKDFEAFNADGGMGKTYETGAFFSANPETAGTYASGSSPNVMPVYLRLKAPLVVDAKGKNWNNIGQSAKVQMPAIETVDRQAQEDENLLAELEGRDPDQIKTAKKKAKNTTVKNLFPGEWDYSDDTASTDDIARWARRNGYDGLIINNVKDRGPGTQADMDKAVNPSIIYVAFAPTQIKSVFNRGTFDANDPRILYQPAYHGTPHLFDKFSLDKMGTGEGAQAFGWGMYFAGKRQVAEFYRNALAEGPGIRGILPDGDVFNDPSISAVLRMPTAHSIVLEKMYDVFQEIASRDGLTRNAVTMALDVVEQNVKQRMVKRIRENPSARQQEIRTKGFDYVEKSYSDQLDYIGVLKSKADTFEVVPSSGRLFKVDIPEDADLLDWDAPLSKQSAGVREKLKSLVDELKSARMNEFDRKEILNGKASGDLFYNALRLHYSNLAYADGGELTAKMKRAGEGWTPENLALNAAIEKRYTEADRLASEAMRAVGIPGHRYLDGGSRADGDGSRNYVIYDEDAVKVLEFQQQARGSITFPDAGVASGQTVINLFEAADLSTFMHEAGHYFLEVFGALSAEPNAPEAMRADMDAINRYLGAEPGKPKTREQHEVWARSVEAYLMEGKAPSLELADAFARVKAWLTRIYQSIKGLNVKLSPEIREVMDRMLATDAEIAAAREAQGLRPLFTDQKAAGMSDGTFAIYQRMARRSTEEAAQALLAKAMDKVRREKQAWWKAERKAVHAEVTGTINSQRPYRLTEMLANQRWLAETPRDVPDIQMNRKELVEMFGAGVLAELSRERLGGKRAIYAEGGASVQEVADLFGFANPQEMVQILQNSGKRADAINRETDRIMLERHGDPLTDGTIEEEAMVAVHAEQQAKTVAAEVRHLASRAGLPTRNLTAQVFRQRANLMIGRMSVNEATRPDAFLAAERKAAKRAEDAFARVQRDGESALVAATRHKEQQLLNHYLYLESRDLAKEVDAGRERMRGYAKASVRKKLEGGYIEQIDALLDQYDFRVRGARQIARDESLTAFVARMTEAGRAAELSIDPRVIERAKKVHYSRLSADELRGLFDTIANIDHMGRFKQKLIDAKKSRDHDEVVGGMLKAFSDNVPPNPPSRTADAGEARRKTFRDYLNTTLNADTLLREIDGFADLGPMWTALKQDIDAGQGRLIERRREMAESFHGIYSRYSAAEQRDMTVKRANDALGVPVSKWNLLAIAMNTGNEGNYQRLTNPKIKGSFTPAQVEAALDALDQRDWEVVQAMWDYIGSFRPEIEAKEKRLSGVAPKMVDAKAMVNAPGFVTGGYYPIKYDPRLSGLTEDLQQKELANSLIGGMFGKAQTANGHTKARLESSRQTVDLDLGVAHQHVDKVLTDLELGEPVANAWKLLQDGRVRAAFRESGKQSDFEALELWLLDTAAGERLAADGMYAYLRHLRTGFTVSRLAFNLSTALIQPSGLSQSAVVIGKEALARGALSYFAKPARWRDDVLAVSPMMRERKATFERDIYNAVGGLEAGPVTGRFERFMRDYGIPASFWMMQTVQFYAVDMPTWVGAYQKELAATKDEAKARTYADAMTKRAQGSGILSDRGAMERGTLGKGHRQHEAGKLLTALGSYMFAKFNVAYEATAKTNFKSPGEVMSLAVDIGLLFTFEAVLYAAVKGGLPDEEDEEWAGWLAKETAMSMLATLPGLREFAGASEGFGGGGIFGSVVESMSRPLIQAAQGDADKAFVKSIIDAGGIIMKLPSSQIKNIVDGLFEPDMSMKQTPSATEALGLGGKGSLADLMFGD